MTLPSVLHPAPGCFGPDAPGEIPDLLALHAANPRRYPHLLASAASGTPRSRFDILFAFPEESLTLGPDGLSGPPVAAPAGRFLDALDRWFDALPPPGPARSQTPVPFTGGWFLALGYELAGEIEPVLDLPAAPRGFPVAVATRFRHAVVADRATGTVHLVSESGDPDHLAAMATDLRAAAPPRRALGPLCTSKIVEEEAARHFAAVARAVDYIRAGDIFQANLSRRWDATLAGNVSHATLFDALRRTNPAPFAALATWRDSALVSSSPERLVSVRDRRIETRPIAGTRPRGRAGDEDRALSDELLAHPKERAEHVMLVDLERNDLSRVAIPGSVRVGEYMALESYAHVHHIVSNVEGMLRDDVTPGQIVAAVFPGGTITGCPKIRCMEIIAELEGEGRGFYTGSIGYLNRDGSMDLNILIRTMIRAGNRVTLRAGGGIVADSDPERELAETRAKAEGLVRALGASGS